LTSDKWVHPNPDETYGFTHKPTQFYEKREKTVEMTTTSELTITEASGGSLQVDSYNDGSSTDCAYDSRGNMSQKGSTNYYFDSENRLVHVDGATDLWFRYDALGRRVAEYDGSSHTLFYYDGLHIAEETDSSLNLNRLCLFGIRIDEVLYAGDTDGSGNLTAHRWPLADHLGSVIAVYDNAATEKTAIDYTTVFGETTLSGAETDFPYGFTGRRRLAAAGLYDYRARAYEPKLGRFLQRDPIGVWGDGENSGNPYSYVGNHPVLCTDPNGTWIVVPNEWHRVKVQSWLDAMCPGKFRIDQAGNVFAIDPYFCRDRTETSWVPYTDDICYDQTYGRWQKEFIPKGCASSLYPVSCCCLCEAIGDAHTYRVSFDPKAVADNVRKKNLREHGHHSPAESDFEGGYTDSPWNRARWNTTSLVVGRERSDGVWAKTGHPKDTSPPLGRDWKTRMPEWLIFAHELCGHALKPKSAIEEENRIRAEHSTEENSFAPRSGEDHE
jgi:RHS repeat-associated protein